MYLCFFLWLYGTGKKNIYPFFSFLVIALSFITWFLGDFFPSDLTQYHDQLLIDATIFGHHGLDWVFFSSFIAVWCSLEIKKADKIDQLLTLSTIDPLTEILNRREFFHAALIELNRSQRYGFNMALLMIDIDNFKVINDTYGHVSGDRALRSLANTARLMLRIQDLLARYGGEEFVVVMPQTTEREAILVAERLRLKIAEDVIETREGSFKMTVSIGMTEFYSGEEMLEDAIDRADQALYHAKKTGKNRVCISRQQGEPVTVNQHSNVVS
ncbi:MAG: GGDEF domain-containing protein [Candidatus Symbiobacter sp.]|nr:GGDEF domain-containing protein [Candidatus Symbiobacter sp.]